MLSWSASPGAGVQQHHDVRRQLLRPPTPLPPSDAAPFQGGALEDARMSTMVVWTGTHVRGRTSGIPPGHVCCCCCCTRSTHTAYMCDLGVVAVSRLPAAAAAAATAAHWSACTHCTPAHLDSMNTNQTPRGEYAGFGVSTNVSCASACLDVQGSGLGWAGLGLGDSGFCACSRRRGQRGGAVWQAGGMPGGGGTSLQFVCACTSGRVLSALGPGRTVVTSVLGHNRPPLSSPAGWPTQIC